MPYSTLIEPSHLINDLATATIGAAIEVHRHLGPGLSELLYERAMVIELEQRGLLVQQQFAVDIAYKGYTVGKGRVDLLVNSELPVEIKSVHALDGKHMTQLITYLRAINQPLGLLVNFNVGMLKNGIRRVVRGSTTP